MQTTTELLEYSTTEAPVDLTGTQLITLDPDKYIAAVFAPFRELLDAAKAGAKGIKAEAATKEGMLVAVKQRALFRALRIEIEAARKNRKAPILEISKKLDSRAHELTNEITPDEDRFDMAIKVEEGRKERERTEREAAEAERMANIQMRIAHINAIPPSVVGKHSSQIELAGANVENIAIDDSFGEFRDQAQAAKDMVDATLKQLYAGALAQERAAIAETKRIAEERAELAQLRAEQEERNRQAEEERRRRAEADAAAQAIIDAERLEARARIEDEERRARHTREEAERVTKQLHDEAEAKARVEKEAIEEKQREIQRRANEVLDGAAMLYKFKERFGGRKEFAAVVKAIDAYFAKQEKAA